MEKNRTFLTGSEPSKDWHSQRCLCSWDFMRGIVDKFDRNTDWAKGQRTLSATEAKIRNYWKSCDHRLPLFPAADPDPKAHSETLASFFWGRWEQKPSDAGPQNPLLLLDRDGGVVPGRGVNSSRQKLLEAGFAGCRNSCELLHIFLKPYMEPGGKVGSAVISAQVLLEEPCNSGISLKTPH